METVIFQSCYEKLKGIVKDKKKKKRLEQGKHSKMLVNITPGHLNSCGLPQLLIP